MPQPIFFIRRSDRLIARLKHMLYAWRFARQVDGKVIMTWSDLPPFWQRYEGVEYRVSNIFDLAHFYAAGGSDSLVFIDYTVKFPENAASLYDHEFDGMRFNNFTSDVFRGKDSVFYETKILRFQLDTEKKKPPALFREIGELFSLIPPNEYLRSVIDKVRAQLGNSPYIGIHVRRGDVYDMLREAVHSGSVDRERFELLLGHYVVRTAPFELYEPEVENAIRYGQKIAFFSDSPACIEWFQTRFGREHFVDMSKYAARLPIQKAFLDFVILKDAERIVSTRSNYASFGAELSGATHVIVSAVEWAELSPDEIVDLYFTNAMREFYPDLRSDTKVARQLYQDIKKLHMKLNRLEPALEG